MASFNYFDSNSKILNVCSLKRIYNTHSEGSQFDLMNHTRLGKIIILKNEQINESYFKNNFI